MTADIVAMHGDKVATTTIEVKINDLTGNYHLPDDAILREKKILDFFALGNPEGDAKSPSGRDLVTNAALRSSYLTLKINNDAQLDAFPLIQRVVNADDRGLSRFEACPLTPSKSFIEVGDPALIAQGQSFILVFIYLND